MPPMKCAVIGFSADAEPQIQIVGYQALGPNRSARPSGTLTPITSHISTRSARGTGTMRPERAARLKPAGRSPDGPLPRRDDHGHADSHAERDDDPRRDLRRLLVFLVEVPDETGGRVESLAFLVARHRPSHSPADI